MPEYCKTENCTTRLIRQYIEIGYCSKCYKNGNASKSSSQYLARAIIYDIYVGHPDVFRTIRELPDSWTHQESKAGYDIDRLHACAPMLSRDDVIGYIEDYLKYGYTTIGRDDQIAKPGVFLRLLKPKYKLQWQDPRQYMRKDGTISNMMVYAGFDKLEDVTTIYNSILIDLQSANDEYIRSSVGFGGNPRECHCEMRKFPSGKKPITNMWGKVIRMEDISCTCKHLKPYASGVYPLELASILRKELARYVYDDDEKKIVHVVKGMLADDQRDCILNTWNEVIDSTDNVHGVFDIDFPANLASEDFTFSDFEDLIVDLITDIQHIYWEKYEASISNENFQISQAIQTNKKYSVHLVVTGYKFKTLQKGKPGSAHDLYLEVIKKNGKRYTFNGECILDEALYSSCHNLRCVYSTKPGSSRFLKPWFDSSEKWEDHLVVSHEENEPFIQIPDDIKESSQFENSLQISADFNLEKLVREYAQQLHPKSTIIMNKQSPSSFLCNYTNRSEPCYTGNIHEGNNGFFMNISGNSIYARCLSSKCSSSHYCGPVLKTEEEIERYKLIKPRSPIIKFPGEVYITDRYLDAENVPQIKETVDKWKKEKGILLVKSLYSTGKTVLVKTLTESPDMVEKRMLFITQRRSLARSLKKSFPDFHSYLDGIQPNHDYPKLIIQVESLHKIIKHDDDLGRVLPNYDIIILDELESILKQIATSPMLINRKLACMTFDMLIQRASYTIGLDSDLGYRGYTFMKTFDKPLFIIRRGNEIKSPLREIHISRDQKSCVEDMITRLNLGENLMVCFLSVKSQEQFRHMVEVRCPNVKSIHYSRLSGKEDRESIEDVNEEWVKYNLVTYTPMISTGVDFTQNHFDRVYCLSNSTACDASTLMQMAARARIVKSGIIHICHLEMNESYGILPISRIRQMVSDRIQMYDIQEFDDQNVLVTKVNKWTEVFAQTEKETIASKLYFISEIKNICAMNNFDVIEKDTLPPMLSEPDPIIQEVDHPFGQFGRHLVEDIPRNTLRDRVEPLIEKKKIEETSREENIRIENYYIEEICKICPHDMQDNNDFLSWYASPVCRTKTLYYLELNGYIPTHVDNSDMGMDNREVRHNIARRVLKIAEDVCNGKKENVIGHEIFRNNVKYEEVCTLFQIGMTRGSGKNKSKYPFEKSEMYDTRSHTSFLNAILAYYGIEIIKIPDVYKVTHYHLVTKIPAIDLTIQKIMEIKSVNGTPNSTS